MERQQVRVWCRLLRKEVEVVLTRNAQASPRAGIPTGWEAMSCLGRDTACYSTGCPFTVEEDIRADAKWPFAERTQPR